MIIPNYVVNFREIMMAFLHYQSLFFFLPNGIADVVSRAAIDSLKSQCDYKPNLGENDTSLFAELVRDLETYVYDGNHYDMDTFLSSHDYLEKLEIAVDQIVETVDHHISLMTPNPITEVIKPRFLGDELHMHLRV